MKLLKFIFIFFCFCSIYAGNVSAQGIAKSKIAVDSTPIYDLDYHLSKSEFTYYYGTDDTARAIINMFYRKRGHALIDFIAVPIASEIFGGIVITLGAVSSIGQSAIDVPIIAIGVGIYLAGSVVYPIYRIAERCIYTRQKLLFILVSRERGQGIPEDVLDNLKDSDF